MQHRIKTARRRTIRRERENGQSAATPFASAQVWRPFEFESDGHYEFRIEEFEYSPWEDGPETLEYGFAITVRQTGALSPDGDRVLEVATTHRRPLPASRLKDTLSLGAFLVNQPLLFGGPFESSVISGALSEMDFAVGERLSILGMGRVSIVEETDVAGRTGLLVRHEAGDAGQRRTVLEWVVDPQLPVPLESRHYDDDGRLLTRTTLVKYEAL